MLREAKRQKDLSFMNFEQTELRLGLSLGLPGESENEDDQNGKNSGKRGFFETIDLKLKLDSSKVESDHVDDDHEMMDQKINTPKSKNQNISLPCSNNDTSKPPSFKAQVVGWPPVRSYRKNILSVQKNSSDQEDKVNNNAAFVKVSLDGAPYLRKVDLKLYKSYQELSRALGKMFSSFTIGNCETQGMKDFMNESKLMDLLNGSEYVPTYEDKDGDWMLVGDVPWQMFVASCKRLRIMKGSEAIGLAPKAVEKCKNRS